MGAKSRTKFKRNPPNRLRDLENGYARAHVQMHSTSDMWIVESTYLMGP